VFKKWDFPRHSNTILVLLFLFFISADLVGQKKRTINILNAETLEYDDALGINVQRLKGDVQFENKGMLLYCDSAYFYPNNYIEAFGSVHANKGDTIHLYSQELTFDGDKQVAVAIGEVKLKDREMSLTTDALNFDIKQNTSSYYTGGVIVNKENTLTSQRGYYNSATKIFSFKDSVKLKNPDYTMFTDTLQFNTVSEIAFFMGPTTIYSDESTIYTEKGWYNTNTNKSELSQNNRLSTDEQTLDADSILYNRNNGIARAFSNIIISDTINKVIIKGNLGRYNQKTQRSFVTDRATMIQIFEEDSLFLHADSLWVYRDTLEAQNEIYAYYGARFFKPDLQGVCDSLVYIQKDSLIRMYREPILWSEQNQITGEYMELLIYDGEIRQLNIEKDAFIISEVDSTHYNQIKGRDMKAIFKNNEMEKIYVNGNGQTVYFAEDEKKKEKKRLIGVNNLDCSDIIVYVKESKIHSMTFLQQPNGVMTPMKKADPSKMRLEGFKLKNDAKPLSKEDIYTVKS
jgi:lipopolysaccharide export system protein LptA